MSSSVVKKDTGPQYEYYDKMSSIKRKMPVSWTLLLSSVLVWMLIFWGCYYAYVYGLMYFRFDDTDLLGECDEEFGETVDENMERLAETPKGDSWKYFAHLGISNKKRKKKDGIPDSPIIADPQTMVFPPIVTAVTSDDFYWVQGLVRQVKEEIKPMYEDTLAVKFVIYGLGLTSSEENVLNRYCDCIVRTVEQDFYPPHVLNGGYGQPWRPLLIQLILKEFGSALWVDPRARFMPENLKDAVTIASSKGFALWPQLPMVIAYTHPSTFQYFKEKRCTFKDNVIIDMTVMVFYSTELTIKGIMTPWLKCSLTQSCVAPSGAHSDTCLKKREPLYTGCHKFDQSALSIVVNRLTVYSENTDKLVPSLRLAESISEIDIEYFPERPWTTSHQKYMWYAVILFIVFSVLTLLFGTFFLECLGIKFRIRPKTSPA